MKDPTNNRIESAIEVGGNTIKLLQTSNLY